MDKNKRHQLTVLILKLISIILLNPTFKEIVVIGIPSQHKEMNLHSHKISFISILFLAYRVNSKGYTRNIKAHTSYVV